MSADEIQEDTTNGDENFDNDQTTDEIPSDPITETSIPESQPNGSPTDPTINPVDEDSQFIYDADSESLICIGSSFDDIPASVIEKYAQKTKILDLSKNRFRTLGCLESFPNLEELILDDNDLDDTYAVFPKLPMLHTLMINKNRLQDIYKLAEQLHSAYPNLMHLSLLGNEACPYKIGSTSQTASQETTISDYMLNRAKEEYERYRHLVIFRIPSLKFLDASEISAQERTVAQRLGDILNSIGESKRSRQSGTAGDDEENNGRKEIYSPLPPEKGGFTKKRMVSKIPSRYNGDGSQGNKFVRDGDL